MTRIKSYCLRVGALAALAAATQVTSFAGEADSGGIKFRFPVGLTYANGASDVMHALEDSFKDNGYSVSDTFVWPVGLSLNPRVEFPCGASVGVAIGPAEFLVVKKNTGYSENTDFNCIVPVGGYLQYNIFRDKKFSPFARAGVRYPFTVGDYLKSSTVGAFVAGGVEIFRMKKIGFGIEAGYDWSQVSVSAGSIGGNRDVKPIGFNVSIFALF